MLSDIVCDWTILIDSLKLDYKLVDVFIDTMFKHHGGVEKIHFNHNTWFLSSKQRFFFRPFAKWLSADI